MLDLYYIDHNYIHYLREEKNNPFIQKYKTGKKPYIGIFISSKNMLYMIPLTSKTKNKDKPKNNDINSVIKDQNGEVISTILFNNMIPIIDTSVIKEININDIDEPKLRRKLKIEEEYLKKRELNIIYKAKKVLDNYDKQTELYKKCLKDTCCNFPKLEKDAFTYIEHLQSTLSTMEVVTLGTVEHKNPNLNKKEKKGITL